MALEVKDMEAVSQTLEAAGIPYQRGTNDALVWAPAGVETFCDQADGIAVGLPDGGVWLEELVITARCEFDSARYSTAGMACWFGAAPV